MCVLVACMPGARGGQKRSFNALELDLGTVVSFHVGGGKLT